MSRDGPGSVRPHGPDPRPGPARSWACTACSPRSRCAPQPFEVDLELLVDLAPAGASDDLADTVDYGALIDAVSRIVATEHYQLLERLAARIAEICRADRACRAWWWRCASCDPPVHGRGRPRRRPHRALTCPNRAARTSRSVRTSATASAHLQLAVDALARRRRHASSPSRASTRPHRSAVRRRTRSSTRSSRSTRDLDPRALLASAPRDRGAGAARASRAVGPAHARRRRAVVRRRAASTTPDLTIPHPRMWERGFVLAPLARRRARSRRMPTRRGRACAKRE